MAGILKNLKRLLFIVPIYFKFKFAMALNPAVRNTRTKSPYAQVVHAALPMLGRWRRLIFCFVLHKDMENRLLFMQVQCLPKRFTQIPWKDSMT